jgi:hypothetical protein
VSLRHQLFMAECVAQTAECQVGIVIDCS